MTKEKLPISVVLLTRNEELNIKDCLQSCAFADELIVVDDGSTDKTVEIAQELGAKVFNRSLAGDWGAQKTFGMQQASQPWLLLIDADERVSSKLRDSIRQVLSDSLQKRAYMIQRENHFVSGSATHGCLRPDWVLRFCRERELRLSERCMKVLNRRSQEIDYPGGLFISHTAIGTPITGNRSLQQTGCRQIS